MFRCLHGRLLTSYFLMRDRKHFVMDFKNLKDDTVAVADEVSRIGENSIKIRSSSAKVLLHH